VSRKLLAPDLFAVTLFGFGAVLLLAPSMRVAGAVAVISSGAYWLMIVVAKVVAKRR
jgi:hypothetical protein